MAIYLDFSGSMFAAIHTDLKGGDQPNLDYLRHLVINTIRYYNKMFRSDYGLLHICLDSKSWRDEIFKYYKYERRENRDGDDNDWTEIFQHIYSIQDEIKEFLPFPVIQAYGAEADDSIGVLAKSNREPSMIVSNDKDFGALLKYDHVEIFRPIVKGKEKHPIKDPQKFEFELIVCGDKADGVPSVRCAEDFYVIQHKAKLEGKPIDRAPPVTAKLKMAWWAAKQQSRPACCMRPGAVCICVLFPGGPPGHAGGATGGVQRAPQRGKPNVKTQASQDRQSRIRPHR